MLLRAVMIWVIGLSTAVPYALLITFILFWIFGYWSLAGPLIVIALGKNADARDAVIALIASENRIPRFIAARVYKLLLARLA